MSGIVTPPALLFLFCFALAICGLFWFHMNLRVGFLTYVKNVIGILMGLH
jgi:hypothetical protein